MEKEKNQEREGKNTSSPTDLRTKLLYALIILGVVALGLLAVNQFLAYQFKAEFLASPCDLCIELNPHLKNCFEYESINRSHNPYDIKINNNEVYDFTLP